VASALLDHLAGKLQISRWQRDLSDSTALRNIGSAFAHSLLAVEATRKGFGRLDVNEARISADLEDSWEVLGEAVQTVMRRLGMDSPYEQLKAATRGERLDARGYQRLLETLELPAATRRRLAAMRPADYVGLAAELARNAG
jgi:adenylosuccinate lyase